MDYIDVTTVKPSKDPVFDEFDLRNQSFFKNNENNVKTENPEDQDILKEFENLIKQESSNTNQNKLKENFYENIEEEEDIFSTNVNNSDSSLKNPNMIMNDFNFEEESDSLVLRPTKSFVWGLGQQTKKQKSK